MGVCPYAHPLTAVRAQLGLSAVAYLKLISERQIALGFGPMGTRREKITRWESGTAEPSRDAQMAMADLHDIAPDAVIALGWPDWLLLVPPHDRVSLDAPWDLTGTLNSARSTDRGAAMDRRGFLFATGTTLTALGTHWAGALDQVLLTPATGRRRVTSSMVNRHELRLDALRHLDDEIGGASLIAAAEVELRMLTGLIGGDTTYDEAVGRRLFVALAEAARLCGWLHFDAGHHSTAQRYYFTALRASATGGAVEVGANTLAFMAIQTYSVGDPRDAVALAQTAQSRARHCTPLMRSMLAARTARALSKTGDANECARQMDIARAVFPDRRHDDDPAWSYWFTTQEIEMLAGSCALDLGDPQRALDHFTAAETQAYAGGTYRRDAALFLARRAEAQLALGEVEQACAIATDAWQQSSQLDSGRPTGQLATFRSHLHRHSTVPAVQEFLERTAA